MQFRQATQQDLWHKAVISILNDTDDSPGDFPTGEGGRGGGARNVAGTKRAINELPLLLGDSGEHLLTMMGIDPAADRLALAEFLQPVEQIRQINTAMLLQRLLPPESQPLGLLSPTPSESGDLVAPPQDAPNPEPTPA